MDYLGVASSGCFAHLQQLVIHKGLLSEWSVSDVVASGRKNAPQFKHLPLAYRHLEHIQIEPKMPQKCIKQDVQEVEQ